MRPSSIPREKIPWYPTIDPDACIGDQVCLDFCKNGVFEWDEEGNHPVAEHPYNCVVGCSACMELCPVQAITFPTRETLRQTMRTLRAEAASAGSGPPQQSLLPGS
ncbi:MAG: ferredoxin family protein [Armatimonadetes bacterium]|nr:ferredoxin family protein [Armatimonadota bacterium]